MTTQSSHSTNRFRVDSSKQSAPLATFRRRWKGLGHTLQLLAILNWSCVSPLRADDPNDCPPPSENNSDISSPMPEPTPPTDVPSDGSASTTTDEPAVQVDASTTDSDGDMLTDAQETQLGTDVFNPDSDQDGISDGDEIQLTGTDPNSTDSNNDGFTDYNEFYGDYAVNVLDVGPGVFPSDWDGDGISDPIDPDPFSAVNIPDSDGDYVPDSEDTDPLNPQLWMDHDRDGLNDDAETFETDFDGDGVSDFTDSNPSDAALFNDWNNNGIDDELEDGDSDGVSDLQDSHPNCNTLWCDWNGNGVNDDAEAGLADSDGDGVADKDDTHPWNPALWDDHNANGINDSEEANVSDRDGDGHLDANDSDPDNASLWDDWNRNGASDVQELSNDSDFDGAPDSSDSDPNDSSRWDDWNRNGTNDSTETAEPTDNPDRDGDGVTNEQDSDPDNAALTDDWNHDGTNDSEQYSDSDGDGIANNIDSHPADPNLWDDFNGNGVNDHAETVITDSDYDGYADSLDSHPHDSTLYNDHNHNGINDEAEAPADSDGDGLADPYDLLPYDFDNDGIPDFDEIFYNSSPWTADSDGDGLSDGQELALGTRLDSVDTDNDGLTDYEEVNAYFTDPLTPTTISSTPEPPPEPTDETSALTVPSSAVAWLLFPSKIIVACIHGGMKAYAAWFSNGLGSALGTAAVAPAGTTNIGNTSPIDPPSGIFTKLYAANADLTDTDGDGIPNTVENLYAPFLNANDPDDAFGDLDGDGLSNIEEYQFGYDIVSGMIGKKPLDYDNDGITDIIEDAWSRLHPSILSKFNFNDAFTDKDGDGLLAIEEVLGYRGSKIDTRLPVTDPGSPYSTYPSGKNFRATNPNLHEGLNLATNVNDGHIRQCIDSILAAPTNTKKVLPANFWNVAKLTHISPYTQGPNGPVRTGAATGRPVPLGFITWATQQGYAMESIGFEVVSRVTTITYFCAAVFPATTPATDDIDGDGMPNAWEAFYGFDCRNRADAGSASETVKTHNPNAKPKLPRTNAPTYSAMKAALDEWLALALIDPDGDGICNVAEFNFHLSPHVPNNANLSVDMDLDADGDGFSNREEIAHNSDPGDPFSQPEATLTIVSGDDQYLSTDDDGSEVVVALSQAGHICKNTAVQFRSDASGFLFPTADLFGVTQHQSIVTLRTDKAGRASLPYFKRNYAPARPEPYAFSVIASGKPTVRNMTGTRETTFPKVQFSVSIVNPEVWQQEMGRRRNEEANASPAFAFLQGDSVNVLGGDIGSFGLSPFVYSYNRFYLDGLDLKSKQEEVTLISAETLSRYSLAQKDPYINWADIQFQPYTDEVLVRMFKETQNPLPELHSFNDHWYVYPQAQWHRYWLCNSRPSSTDVSKTYIIEQTTWLPLSPTPTKGYAKLTLTVKGTSNPQPMPENGGPEPISHRISDSGSVVYLSGTFDTSCVEVQNGICCVKPKADKGTITAFDLLPVEVMQHPISATSGAGAPPSSSGPIRFCRWLDAYPNGQRDNQFADKDRDRFQIGIPSVIPNLTKMTIKATDLHGAVINGAFQNKTTDGNYEVDMKQENGGMVSEPILLVSDGDDDVTFNGKGADNGKNDQTLLADFGSKIVVTFPELGNAEATFQAQQPIGTITLDMVYCHPKAVGGLPVNMPGDMIPLMERQAQKMREIYRQIGIKVDGFSIGLITFSDTWVQYSAGSPYLNGTNTDALMALVASSRPASTRIRVGFVNAALTDSSNGNSIGGKSNGIGNDPCLVSIDNIGRRSYNVLAHEAGHASTLGHNYPSRDYRLMRESAGSYWSNDSNAAKRFMWDDADYIKANSSYYVPAQ